MDPYSGNQKNRPPIPTPKPVLPSFKIVEEYILDDQEATASDNSNVPVSAPSSSDVITLPQYTEVLKNASGNIVPDACDTDLPETKTSLLHEGVETVTMTDSPLECGTGSTRLEPDPAHQLDIVGTSGADTDDIKTYPNDDNPEHDLLLSAYPWTMSACVNLLESAQKPLINRLSNQYLMWQHRPLGHR